jgi:heterodisulfide reductase subunit B
MKFSRLIEKAEQFGDKVQQGRRLKPKKLTELQRLLGDKIARYEARLKEDMTKQKHRKLETRLKVVMAQLKKAKQLSATS